MPTRGEWRSVLLCGGLFWASFRVGLYLAQPGAAETSAVSGIALFLSVKSLGHFVLAVLVAWGMLLWQRWNPPRTAGAALVRGAVITPFVIAVPGWTLLRRDGLSVATTMTAVMIGSLLLVSWILYRLRPPGATVRA